MALTLNNNLLTMEVGDYVWCKYTASSNAVGTFSDFATKTDAEVAGQEIPVVSSDTPNGYFKFIMVEDWNGQKRLIADRNVQHSISWDVLNTSGIASGSGLPVAFLEYPNSFAFTTHLLTGGVSATDKDNEWDKYIVNSALNGAITAGNNNVWNYGGGLTWCSTSQSTSSSHRITRGKTTVEFRDYYSSSTSSTNIQFRPVLLIDSVSLNKSFILFNGEYKKWTEGSPEILEKPYLLATPKMTSNTTPSGKAFSETSYSIYYDAWYAFNQADENEGYSSANGSGGNGFLGYQFPSAVVITKYAIRSMASSSFLSKMPKNWTFEGSNDSTNGTDGTWIVLDARTSQTWTTILTDNEYIISIPQSFKTYRLKWTANVGDASYTDINELKLYSYIPYTPATPSYWKTISTTLPSVDTFKSEGMDDLSVLDRKSTEFIIPMDDNGVSGAVLGEGKVFKEKIDLKKFFDIKSIKIK